MRNSGTGAWPTKESGPSWYSNRQPTHPSSEYGHARCMRGGGHHSYRIMSEVPVSEADLADCSTYGSCTPETFRSSLWNLDGRSRRVA